LEKQSESQQSVITDNELFSAVEKRINSSKI